MFTSRSELRLSLREDNAFLRLYRDAYSLGLMDKKTFIQIKDTKKRIKSELSRLKKDKICPCVEVNRFLKNKGYPGLRKPISFYELLKRPGIQYKDLAKLSYSLAGLGEREVAQIEIEAKYEGFIKREKKQLKEIEKIGRVKIPKDINYKDICGLSKEIREKLTSFKPKNLKQAFDIPGVTIASIILLLNYINRLGKNGKKNL